MNRLVTDLFNAWVHETEIEGGAGAFSLDANGMAALGSMLQSCTFGLAVVNIDNGIGAGAFAASIANRMATKKKDTTRT